MAHDAEALPGPLRRVHLLHVIHEIKPHGPRRARVNCCKNAWLPVSGDFLSVVETSVAKQIDRQITALRNAAILRRNGRLPNPILQPSDRFVVPFLNFATDAIQVRLRCSHPRPCESRCANRSLDESSPIHDRWELLRSPDRENKLRSRAATREKAERGASVGRFGWRRFA